MGDHLLLLRREFDSLHEATPWESNKKSANPHARIGAHIRKAPSIENRDNESEAHERAHMGVSDLQACPLSEGTRKLFVRYTRRQWWAQGASRVCILWARDPIRSGLALPGLSGLA